MLHEPRTPDVPPPQTPPRTPDSEPPKQSNTIQFEELIKLYLSKNPEKMGADYQTKNVPELEVRFGTGKGVGARNFTKVDYDLVVQSLYSAKFAPERPNGDAYLRIQNEYYDKRINRTKISNVRAEIVGLDLIQEYCRTNSIQKLLDMKSTESARSDKIKFTQKSPGDPKLRMVDFPDMGFRVSYQLESYYNPRADISRKIIEDWKNSKKVFRYLNRVRFAHPDIPVFVDISIVKKSKTMNHVPIPHYSIQDSGVFENQESYEIELEIDNKRANKYSPNELLNQIKNMIRLVMGALQQTKYPIGMKQMKENMTEYMYLIHHHLDPERPIGNAGDEMTKESIAALLDRKDVNVILPKYFIGPSSYTLQLDNIVPSEIAAKTSVPNIRTNYTVTDKADGERRLLFINSYGRIYMITTNMQFIFTGAVAKLTKENRAMVTNTLLDGEFISYDKKGEPLNLYMAFDAYFIGGKSVRQNGFYPITVQERTQGSYRYLALEKYVREILKLEMAVGAGVSVGSPCGFSMDIKNFYVAAEGDQIFEACGMILSKEQQGAFVYNTDGLIFTPALTGVGADRIGVAGRMRKETWELSFKWKPPKYNTIDFLVTVKKDKKGEDEIHYRTMEGRNLTDSMRDIQSYKTLILRCGFDPKVHGFLNPCSDVLHDRIPGKRGGDMEDWDHYKAVPFQPSNPEDPNACFCNVQLHTIAGKMVMMTEADTPPDNETNQDTHQPVGEYFGENTIVEFKYDMKREGFWKWVPIRVRYDKTAELRSGQRNYGNSYHVANSNWASIHSPITFEMITTGEGIPTVSYNHNDVYYNRKNRDSYTKGLRNFHNLYVKRSLIMGVANSQDRLIDFAVGKAGDLSKWRMADLKFVLGVDVAGDNIMNKRDGACARYLNDCRTYRDNMPKCLFFVGDSAKNIRSTGEAFAHAVDRQYVNAVFGKGDKNPNDLPPGVYRSYGIAENGFDIASCQFAIHYFFETDTTLHQFLRNIAETVRVGGYFIGTTYDGETVYKTLKNVPTNQAWTVLQKGQKIAEITKEYEDTGEFMPEEEDSIGMRIQVYQESINQTIPEYLVNFKYFRYLMELYGFTLVPDEEAQRKTKLPHGTGLFQELFHRMESEIKNGAVTAEEYGQALYMTAEEKKISYLNRYFVFRKVHTVEPENIFKILQSKYGRKKAKSDEEPSSSRKPPTSNIVRTKKLKKKLIIRSVDTGATMEAIQDAPMGTELKVKVRKPKSVTKKLNGGSGEFDSDDDGDYHQIQGGELDGSVDIYALKPYGDKTSERANLYMNVSQRTNPVEQTEEFLKTMVSGDPLEFVHKKVSVRENPDYVA